ncbi:MAG: TIGR04190 family B12-binding domain/radical SAM domain protein [Chloroflexi bacterium]|nr:TIGR04190 family B12-binding domain/radical SAM domain protein [Chloroflexota bacterium]MBU1751268.1 TIGR04190 family B12-binding domain/radical SAM domain protein [Chloroflexota bacterium]
MFEPAFVLLHAPSVYDFRERSILFGPVSDVVPSSPVFEMYPIGFTSIAEYVQRHGYRTKIINLALRMLNDPAYDVPAVLRKLHPRAFGIDLHWMPHAQGSVEVARVCKQVHPDIPVVFGGLSASYFHEELIQYDAVDYVVRGDSAEEPMRQLLDCIAQGREPADVPNLTWKDAAGQVHVNPLTWVPDDVDGYKLDYTYVVEAVVRDRDLKSYVPFDGWLDYPATAAFTCRGCTRGCVTCGGSAAAFRRVTNRGRIVYRSPEAVIRDIKSVERFTRAPVFILGDFRQAGDEYADRLLTLAERERVRAQIMMEFFGPADEAFMQRVGRVFPNFVLEISLESHDEAVRRAFGKPYDNAAIEATMQYALEAGCSRLDLFFMIGLPLQTYQSVLDTVDYCEMLLERFKDYGCVFPFVAPMAPFLDPGSLAFENPDRYGYRLIHRTLEEHRQALLQPSWKYTLNYETQWLTRDEIVQASYEAGRRLNRVKERLGLIDAATAADVAARIDQAQAVLARIDAVMAEPDPAARDAQLAALKAQVDESSISTICEKKELNVPVGLLRINVPRTVAYFARRWAGLALGVFRR